MTHSITVNSFNSICRICLVAKNDMISTNSSTIIYMLESCTSVQEILNKNLPQQICIDCHERLKSCFYFKQQYLMSIEILTKIFQSENSVTENETTETINQIKDENSQDTENENMIMKNENDNCDYETSEYKEYKIYGEKYNCDTKIQLEGKNNSDIENYLDTKIKKPLVKLKRRRYTQKNRTTKTNLFNNNEYICDICGKKFQKQKYLKVHKISHSNARPYECTVCRRTFKHTFTLATHMRGKHNDPDRREMCFICGRFILPSSFSYHLSTHRGASNVDEKFKCDICERAYTREDALRRHFQEKHTDSITIRFYCDICNKGYVSKGSLKIHKIYTHIASKNLKCQFCEKSFKMVSHLNAHINAAHKDLRPHKCSTCNKAFHTKTLLRKHMICHTGERSHSCEICGKSFGTKSVLKTHQKVHSK